MQEMYILLFFNERRNSHELYSSRDLPPLRPAVFRDERPLPILRHAACPPERAGSPARRPARICPRRPGQRAAVNARWQLIFGAILLVAVILAVVVLISMSLNSGGAVRTTPTLPAAPDR